MIYLRNRYYDPSIGRFTQEDPVKDGLNWYAYCGNDPVNFVDPWGLKTFEALHESMHVHSEWLQEREGYISEILMSIATTTAPITVVESENAITIYAYVSISGESADTIIPGTENSDGTGGITYRQAAVDGIKTYWSGTYDGKNVRVVVMDVNDGNEHKIKDGQKSLSIVINNGNGVSNNSDWCSKSIPGIITMYQGDNRNNYTYTQDDFSRTVAHEFGHALGIGDLYNDTGIAVKFPSIMNSQWEVNGAQSVDYAMMLKAQTSGRWQTWSNNKVLLQRMGIKYNK